MPKKAEIVPISRFRRGNPLDGVPEIELGLVSEDNRAVRPTSAPAVDLGGLPKTWFLIGNGGAGKTTYARWLIDRMIEQGRQAALAALDPGTRALSSWYDEIMQPASREAMLHGWTIGSQNPQPHLRSSDADGVRASQLQHPVQDMNGDANLGCPTFILVRSQPVAAQGLCG
jgi:hypothetical protein